MNILLVNPAHPKVKHISAVRASRFGCELASRGHRVVILTAVGPDGRVTSDADMAEHDWQTPYVLAPARLRESSSLFPFVLLRRAETLLRMVSNGGYQGPWAKTAAGAVIAGNHVFQPEVLWTTYGKMEAVFLAQRLARHLNVPWVLDLKDNWELYVPKGLRRLMAWRTRGWKALTANGELTRDQGKCWQRSDPTLIYSGVDEVFLKPHHPPAQPQELVYLNLVGGLYFDRPLEILLHGIARWAESRPKAALPVLVRYFGADGVRFSAAAARLLDRVAHKAMGYVPPETLAAACQQAMANAYLGHPGTFHHKTLELLAAGRPLLVCPAERDESRRLTAQVSGQLIEADSTERVADACARMEHEWQSLPSPLPNFKCRRYAWPAQADLLEGVLLHVAER